MKPMARLSGQAQEGTDRFLSDAKVFPDSASNFIYVAASHSTAPAYKATNSNCQICAWTVLQIWDANDSCPNETTFLSACRVHPLRHEP